MFRMAVTGGIACGKTLVSDELALLGAVVIDADLLAREVVEPGSAGLREVAARFGDSVLLADGSLDRAALGEMIFGDAVARSDLNSIIHPRVRAAARCRESVVPEDGVVAHVIPLLVETGQQGSFDAVIVVDIPEEVQLSRLMERNDLSVDQARARVAAQSSRTERLDAADWVIDNSGEADLTLQRVRELWYGPITQLREGRLALPE
ncbi:MAG: dephospho-CoA kinase [Arachnia sp.]